MKYIIFIIVLFNIIIQAQDIPSGYTPNLGLRLYNLDDYPGSDSLNANAQLIDAGYKRNRDSLAALQTDVYGVIKYTGGLKAGIVTNASLATEVDTSRLKTTGNDAVYGSKYFYNTSYMKALYPITDDLYNIGSLTLRHMHINAKRFYGEQFILVNPSTVSDTAIISYDGTKISINKPVTVDDITITTSISMDSAAAFEALQFFPTGFTYSNIGDSVITLDSTMTFIMLNTPGSMTNGTETLTMDGASVGLIVILTTSEMADSILFSEDTDGNINLDVAGDFWMRNGDSISFIYMIKSTGPVVYQWNELWRKNN